MASIVTVPVAVAFAKTKMYHGTFLYHGTIIAHPTALVNVYMHRRRLEYKTALSSFPRGMVSPCAAAWLVQ